MTASSPVNSCEACPSYLPADEAQRYFKKNIGAPMCARFGHVLGAPNLKPVQVEIISKRFAETCPNAGDPRPVDPPAFIQAQVSVGDPKIMMAGPTDALSQKNVSSCVECVNYVRPEAVKNELGWPTGLCAATGRLIMPHLLTREAKNCEYRAPGANRGTAGGMALMPIYVEAFEHDPDPISAFLARRRSGKATIIDPTLYVSDKPVDPDEDAAGIRAWRKISDPSGSGRHTFLPIYKREIFDATEAAKIPNTGDDEHAEMYVDHLGLVYKVAIAWRELDETPMLWGVAGTGKTELFRHLAWLMQLPFDRLSITAQTDVDDLIGKMLAGGGSTYFQYGRLPKRWTKPGIILLDEPNTGPDEVWQTIRPLTDNSKQLVIDQNNGEHLPRHPDCYLGMAANPAWDVRNVGANVLGDADGNRLVHVSVTLPPEPIEKAILEDRCKLDDFDVAPYIDKVMKVAAEIRHLTDPENGTLPISWGIRPQIKVIRAMKWFEPMEAYKLAVANYLEPEQAKIVLDVVQSHFGDAQPGHAASPF